MFNTAKRGWKNRREGPRKSPCYYFVAVTFSYFVAEKQHTSGVFWGYLPLPEIVVKGVLKIVSVHPDETFILGIIFRCLDVKC